MKELEHDAKRSNMWIDCNGFMNSDKRVADLVCYAKRQRARCTVNDTGARPRSARELAYVVDWTTAHEDRGEYPAVCV